ncbi:MAG: glycosyltransferase [bacterium]|jgi:glycosyltransferase involved in cell wall biosynthesis
MKKVLLCRIDGNFGGVERFILSLATNLDPERYQPVIIPIAQDAELARMARAAGIRIILLPMPSRLALFSTASRLAEIARSEKATLIHTFGLRSNTLMTIAQPRLRLPWVIRLPNVSSTDYHNPLRGKASFWLNNLCIRRADALQVISPQLQTLVQQWKYPPKQIFLIPNGVDTSFYRPDPHYPDIRKQYAIPHDALLIGSVGRLDPIKGYDRLLHAFSRLSQQFPHAWLLLVGDGPQAQHLRQIASELGITPKVVFAGYQSDVRPFLQAMNLFICSSISEGVPNAVMEAMAMERPVISTRVGGVESIISHEQDGILIPSNQIEHLSQIISDLPGHPQKMHSLGTTARRKIEQEFSVTRMAERVQAMYDQLIQERNLSLGYNPNPFSPQSP